ncbi:hypothetical protein SEA_DALANDE_21 [Gordonia phage DalanDe]|nr:hypothetical protein SEA_DALANDE_21 [Gordonia phage DalanDe]
MSGEWRAGSLADQIAFTKTLLDTHIETKGRIRRVRTPEGARKYGLPIGSIITADALRTVARAATRRAEQVGGALAPDASTKNDNNAKVAYRVIRQDKDLKGVDLKSGKHTRKLLDSYVMNNLTSTEGAPPLNESLFVQGYRSVRPIDGNENERRRFRMPEIFGMQDASFTESLARGTTSDVRSEFDHEVTEIRWTDKRNRTSDGRTSIEVRPTNNPPRGKSGQKLKYVATLETGRRRGGGWRQFLAETPEEAFEAAARAVLLQQQRMTEPGDDYDAEGMWPVNRRPRDYDGVIEKWPGIRGWDFALEDSDSEVDFSSKTERYKLARQDALEMGYEWATKATWLKDDGSVQAMPVEVMETVNALMRAHDDQYPGIAQLFSQIGLMRDGWATAYNGGGYQKIGEAFTHTVGVMGMNEKYFSDGQLSLQNAARIMNSGRERADMPEWHVNRGGDDLYARTGDTGMTPQQMIALQVMTHEIGHSVGYILQGRIFDVVGGKHTNSSFYGGRDNPDSVTQFHRARMLEILTEYGMFDPKKADKIVGKTIDTYTSNDRDIVARMKQSLTELLDDEDGSMRRAYGDERYQSMIDERRKNIADLEARIAKTEADAGRKVQHDWMTISGEGFANDDPFNRQAISEHLGEYAATNVSEIMAETWAAYHLQENPGDFVREMGDLMVAALDDYLAETDMTKMPKPRAVVEARKAKGLPTWDNRHVIEVIRGEGSDRSTATVRKLLAEKNDDSSNIGATILNGAIVKGKNVGDGSTPEFYSIDEADETTDPPVLVMRRLIVAENGMHITDITDDLVRYNFETDEWEKVPA